MSDHALDRGKFPCPKCKSQETGTDTIYTSGAWVYFLCDACGHEFRKSAEKLSKRPAWMVRLAQLPKY